MGLWLRVMVHFSGLGFRVEGLGLRVQGLGFRVQGLGLRVYELRFGVYETLRMSRVTAAMCFEERGLIWGLQFRV